MAHSNELQKLHFEIKRINLQLEQLRTQFKHLATEHIQLRSDTNSWAKKAGVLAPENVPAGAALPELGGKAVPEGVGGEVQKP